ncbi:MAG TPA: dNTP triphosphohydrolase [Terriglobia bacterium]|nr:dNTP triphosphohydrolase [Terriglobia bacterium]
MRNRFYTDFDTETLESRTEDKYRTPFQIDRDRIVHGHPFRRLQGKTQVFLTGEYDFYRTRLTHSMEVAQIGRSICNVLQKRGEPMQDDFYVDQDLVEAACLAHDLGNPPFGHAGEHTLHQIMKSSGGFEGNAQSLRLVGEMFYGTMINKTGMKPTRAFVDAVLKYKVLYDKSREEPNGKFLYPDQARYLDFVFRGEEWSRQRHDLPKSIECQIMDWSDNVAYGVDDLKDAIAAGFISSRRIREWVEDRTHLKQEAKQKLNELADAVEKGFSDEHLSKRMGALIGHLSLEEVEGFMSDRCNRYRFHLKVDNDMEAEYKAYRDLARETVFATARIQQLEFKADHVLRKLFHALEDCYDEKAGSHLLPEDWHYYIEKTKTKDERRRTICDFVSGMTDAFAGRYFQRFFLPDYGSLTDLV